MTNVKPEELNYDHYEMDKYDLDIINAIPGHAKLHQELGNIVREKLQQEKARILELGPRTGLTTKVIADIVPNAEFTLIDFSEQMLEGAKKRLSKYTCTYVLGDFADVPFPKEVDAVFSVIGFHHQETDEDKQRLIKRVFKSLRDDGLFILGDLMTHDDKEDAALYDAYHFHHLVEKAEDEKSLREWAYHHKYLNPLASWQKHVTWLKEIGFRKVEVKFQQWNTFLIVAEK